MISPEPLRKGDTIGILSTARKISEEELLPARAILEELGYKVRYAPHLFAEDRQFAGSDEQRCQDFQTFIEDPEIAAILCARGGYGSVRIVDQLNFLPFNERPKWVGGYSDVTVIHNRLQQLGFESLHCSMPINFNGNTQEAIASLAECLEGKAPRYQWSPHPLNRQGTAEGELCGGNLSVLFSQMGSPTALDTQGKILFIEDLDEYLYHIDRMMLNLQRAGYLKDLAGMLIGGMSDMRDNAIPFGRSAEEIIREQLRHYDFPVAYGCPAGHIDDNRCLIMGRKLRLDVGPMVTLAFNG